MPQLTIDQFGIGIDTRRGPNVSDANRLRVCTNAFIDNGKGIQKRPGLRFDLALNAGTKGLAGGGGELATFSAGASPVTHSGTPTSGKTYSDKLLVADTESTTTWAPSVGGITVDTLYTPTVDNGRRYRATAVSGAATTGATEPVWPSIIGASVVDNPGVNEITWTCEGDTPSPQFAGGADDLSYVWYATIMNGYWVVIGEDDATPAATRLFYLDGTTPNEVTDYNCPLNNDQQVPVAKNPYPPAAIKLADRVFLNNFEEVTYCALQEPADWSDESAAGAGAGFLPVGRQALGGDEVLALGQYQGDLITLFEDTAQSWNVDASDNLNAFQQSIDGVGSRYSRSVTNLAGDTFFLSTFGFRSVSLLSLTNNLADVDVGTAIDDIVREALSSFTGVPISLFYPKLGQFVSALGEEAFVYTFSRTAKVSAWSKYEWAIDATDVTTIDSELFVRSADDVYYLDDTLYQDETDGAHAGVNFDVDVEMAFLDFKKPGKLKYIWAFDVTGEGKCEVAFKYQYYPAEWRPSAAYAIDDYMRPTTANGRRYRCTTAGTSAATEPVWGTTVGGTTTDGTAVWTCEFDAPVTDQTDWQTVYGNTRPGDLFPVEVMATQVAPVFRVQTDENWRLTSITLHYDTLGEQQ